MALVDVGLTMPNRFRFESLESRSLLSGYTPDQVRAAYGFASAYDRDGPAARGEGVTIAIVDADNDPTLSDDLAVYDRHYGLAKADLSIVNLGTPGNTGGQSGWSEEEALDVETAHALQPFAHIIVVEARSSMLPDLAEAEQYAASLPGVDAISNSWGAVDDAFDGPYDATFDGTFNDPHLVYAAAAGDASGPLSYPAASPDVVAVGGTVLTHNASGYHQMPWLTYTAGGANPAKTGPDVRMIGGPSGLEVFGTSGFGKPTWTDVWGTSLACPAFIAVVGAADGVRIARREAPLTTQELLTRLGGTDETPTAPQFIEQFA
jgi:subtilase family serine protease